MGQRAARHLKLPRTKGRYARPASKKPLPEQTELCLTIQVTKPATCCFLPQLPIGRRSPNLGNSFAVYGFCNPATHLEIAQARSNASVRIDKYGRMSGIAFYRKRFACKRLFDCRDISGRVFQRQAVDCS